MKKDLDHCKADQANELVYGSSLMTIREKRLYFLAVVQLTKYHQDFPVYEIPAKQLIEYLGLNSNSYGKELKDVCNKLLTRAVMIDTPTGWKGFQFVSECEYINAQHNNGTAVLRIGLHKNLKPFLLHLNEKYQSIQFANIASIGSIHAIRIFEILWHKRHETGIPQSKITIPIDDFKRMLGIEKTKTYKDSSKLRTKILEPSVENINQKTPLMINAKIIKGSGRGCPAKEIEFDIAERDNYVADKLPKVTQQMLLDLKEAPSDNKARKIVYEVFNKNLDREIYDPKYERWIKVEKRDPKDIDKCMRYANEQIRKKANTSDPVRNVTSYFIKCVEEGYGL
tara:strand:+ start:59 stop:1078 length:1020 start_codon:yes stop_codon:yes gene_type:complete